MSIRRNHRILLMDNGCQWVVSLKAGLEFMAPEFQVTVADTESDAVGACIRERNTVVIMDPEDFQSIYLMQILRKIPGERLFLLMVSREALFRQRKLHQDSEDVAILVRPCSFKIVYQNIQNWTYGKMYAISDELCHAHLQSWGFSPGTLGFHYLCGAISEMVMDSRQPMKAVYAALESQYHNSAKNIQCAIRNAVKNAWDNGKLKERFEKIPNNRELLNLLCMEVDKKS